MFRGLHDLNCGSLSTLMLANVIHATGDHALALHYAQEAAAVASQLGFHHSRASAHWIAGRIHEAQGHTDAARDAYFAGMREVKLATSDAALPGLLEAIAGMHPDTPVAPRLLGAAARESRNAPAAPSERDNTERWRTAVRAARGSSFESEMAPGRSLSRDEAIAAALSLAPRDRP